jgi:hypothetical protein
MLQAVPADTTDNGDLIIRQAVLIDSLRLAAVTNTTNYGTLLHHLRALETEVPALRAELRRISGTTTAVSTTTTPLVIHDTLTVTVPGEEFDFTHTAADPWITIQADGFGEDLSLTYKTTFSLHEFDVEQSAGNARVHVYRSALVSDVTGDTLKVPSHRTVTEYHGLSLPRLEPGPSFHARGGVSKELIAGVGVSAFQWRSMFGPELGIGGGDGFGVWIAPGSVNLGSILPIVDHLEIAPAWWIGDHSAPAVMVGLKL